MNKYIFIPDVHIADIEDTKEIIEEEIEDFAGDLDFTVIDDYDELPNIDEESVEVVLSTKCELANTFTTLDNWIKHTSLACWYCGLTFDNIPWFIPVIWTRDVIDDEVNKYNINLNFPDNNTRREITIIRTSGNFCGPCCVRKAIESDDKLTTAMKKHRINMLYHIYRIFNGRSIKFIPPAINRTRMKRYCGNNGLTDKEYRELNNELIKNNL